jgi:hypothetical protein
MLNDRNDNFIRVGHADGVRRLPNAKTKLFFPVVLVVSKPILQRPWGEVGEAVFR